MEKQQVKITVKKNGEFVVEPIKGFSGSSCIEKTKDLELVLGGEKVSTEKKPEFYDGSTPDLGINLSR